METKQHRVSISREVLTGLSFLLILTAPLRAQYTADYQTNIISGVASNWSGSYIVGSNTFADVLSIRSGGSLRNNFACAGFEASSSNNSISVAGLGSFWNTGDLYIGYSGAGNSLVISNTAGVIEHYSTYLGFHSGSDSNSAYVTDPDSDLTSALGSTYVGYSGSANSLVISNAGRVRNSASGYLGYNTSSSNNNVLIIGNGSVWSNTSLLYVGYSGAGNSLVISNGGHLIDLRGSLGNGVNSINNAVLVSGTGSVWNSMNYLFIGERGSGNSLVISHGGQVFADDSEVGSSSDGNKNAVLVTDQGSVWSNRILIIGQDGSGNSLVISNGGRVIADLNSVSFGPGSNNSVLVTGSGSVWNARQTLDIALAAEGSRLEIRNGGQVLAAGTRLGSLPPIGSNSALVADFGSVWNNSGSLVVGASGGYFSLVVSNGGQVVDTDGVVGSDTFAYNHTVFVTGSGSVWSNSGSLCVGGSGSYNSLVISNGGEVVNDYGIVGQFAESYSNNVRVVDGGVWRNGQLQVGDQGARSALEVYGGSVLATGLVVGVESTSWGDVVELGSGNLIIMNATGDAVLEVRCGQLILNGGTLQVDHFVMTNDCAQFVRTGGTLIYGSAVLDPTRDDDGDGIPNGWEQAHSLDPLNAADANLDSDGDGFTNLKEFQAGTDPTTGASTFCVTGVLREGNNVRVMWTMGAGRTNALQATTGSDYDTNMFADIFTVTNTIGNITNYLDVGGATNSPSRFYRVRLIP